MNDIERLEKLFTNLEGLVINIVSYLEDNNSCMSAHKISGQISEYERGMCYRGEDGIIEASQIVIAHMVAATNLNDGPALLPTGLVMEQNYRGLQDDIMKVGLKLKDAKEQIKLLKKKLHKKDMELED